KEGKQRLLVPLKPLPISCREVARGSLSRNHVSVEAIDQAPVFAQMTGFKTEPLSVFEKRNQQAADRRHKPLKFIVKWILPKIIIQVSDQMDEAFLLPTRKRIVSPIKISDDGTLESGKQWLQKLRLAARPQPKNHPRIIG